MKNVYKILVGKSERKIPHGRHEPKWEVNTKMDLKEIRFEEVDQICLL
jgi:hypothetical protein